MNGKEDTTWGSGAWGKCVGFMDGFAAEICGIITERCLNCREVAVLCPGQVCLLQEYDLRVPIRNEQCKVMLVGQEVLNVICYHGSVWWGVIRRGVGQ